MPIFLRSSTYLPQRHKPEAIYDSWRESKIIEKNLRSNEEAPSPQVPIELQRWHELCRRYPLLWTLCSPHWNECPPPAAMSNDDFRALVGTLRSKLFAPILVELLMELLGPELLKLIQLATKKKRKGFK